MAEMLKEEQYYTYKGKPLIRDNDMICYGSMKDKYVLLLMIVSDKVVKKEDGTEVKVPDNIIVQLLSTDTSKPSYERIVKQVQRQGLMDAMDIGMVWLEGMNGKA